ncbi:MAG: nucleotidyl transferase AbiEii/AbiGii toxin family protein [Planctomycetes bacterium]|nr:nucleotidyl transferase AbiEii/AbiGii toxin family protein [Planctomycetota bacterium]
MPENQANIPQTLTTALEHLADVLEHNGVRYAVIGAVAAAIRSRPRYTQDIDLLLNVPQLALPGILAELQGRGFNFDAETVIREWTTSAMTALDYQGVRVDLLKPVLPLFHEVIEKATEERFENRTLRVATAEGLIALKLLSFRPQDRADIASLLAANRDRLDIEWIRREFAPFDAAEPQRWREFEQLLRESAADDAVSQEISPC